MRGWKDLEVVETIYEEDQEEEEEDGSNSLLLTPSPTTSPTPPHSSSSPTPPPPPPSLENRVAAWSKATGCKTNVIVRVHDQSFHLHRDPLISRSGYLRRKLTEADDIVVASPSGITAETFAEAVCFCYGADLSLTPSNLAAMWVAAEWLEMADDVGDGGGSLVQQTEEYFRQEVAGDAGRAAAVLRGCLGLLPGAAEAAAGLAVRCVDVLEDGGDEGWLDDVASLSAEEFRAIAESMRAWFAHDHDLLYRIVDHYLANHSGKLTEEEKTRICYTVNCTKLSHHLLVHLVQNPRLPLRFVVQAMLIEQLHTRHSIIDLPAAAVPRKPAAGAAATSGGGTGLTLGTILQRDAALRQVANLRATMEATSLRIGSLERDLAGLRRRLRWSEEKRAEMEAVRSESFRFVRDEEEVADQPVVVVSSGKSCNGHSSRNGRSLGRKLVHGLKSMFRTSSAKAAGVNGQVASNGVEGDLVVVDEDDERRPRHRRNRSFA